MYHQSDSNLKSVSFNTSNKISDIFNTSNKNSDIFNTFNKMSDKDVPVSILSFSEIELWGDHGQAALEGAKICLINASATGTEVLKNLILPGIGSFTIVDGKKVAPEDVGNNFFFDVGSIGKNRAQAATELLSELNQDVTGYFVEDTVENLLDNNCGFYSKFSIVIATELCERTLLRLAELLYDYDIPLMVCRCYGFIGYIRLVLKEHTVVESHPDSTHEDLRLDRPFPALSAFCDSLDLDSMNNKDHSHTPWLVLVYKYLQQWKAQHEGVAPKNYKEKNEFKELIRSGIRKNKELVPEDEENFDEAIKNVNTALVSTKIPDNVRQLFDDNCCCNLTSDSSPFWVICRAVKEFVQKEGGGALPVRGSIPDMTSDSDRYIQLQNAYREQAVADVASVITHVHSLTSAVGMAQEIITDADIKLFCKNASFLRVIRTRSLEEEYKIPYSKAEEIGSGLEDTEYSEMVFYAMLRAVDRFHAEFSRYPGTEQMESDIPKLKSCLNKLLQDWGLTQTVKDDYVHELYGAAELHSVAAYIGGAAAQEVIKVITHQYVPINNSYVYNAVKQTSMPAEL